MKLDQEEITAYTKIIASLQAQKLKLVKELANCEAPVTPAPVL